MLVENRNAGTVTFRQGTWFEPKDGGYQRMIVTRTTTIPGRSIGSVPVACMQRGKGTPANGLRFFSRPKAASGAVQQCQVNCLRSGGGIQSCVWGCEHSANRNPVVRTTIADANIDEGQSLTYSLPSYFSDPDGDTLSYSAQSNSTRYVTARVSGSQLTVTGVRGFTSGAATITVTARDPRGLSVQLRFW